MDCPFRYDKSASSFAKPLAGAGSMNGEVESTSNNIDHSVVDEESGGMCLYYTVQDGIRCAFQHGFKVTRLLLGSLDSTHNKSSEDNGKTLAIAGLTWNISKEDLVARLEPFGPVTSLPRKQPTYALVSFGEARQAEEAVKALCGSSVQSWMKSASMKSASIVGSTSVVPETAGRGTKHKSKSIMPRTPPPVSATGMVSVSLLQNQNQAVTTRGVAIKFLWYAPSRCAWVHFTTLQMATAAAKACHGAAFCGQRHHHHHHHQQRRILTASVQAPTMGQRRSFSVWIGGLPDQVREEELKRFVHKHSKQWVTSVALGDVPFQENQGAAIVKTLLEKHGAGRLVHFEEFSDQGEPLKRRALAKFSNVEQASKACRYFGATKHVSELGGCKLLLTRIFLAKSTVSNSVFCAIETELIAKLSTLQDTRYKFFRNEKTTTISVNAERPESIASAKVALRSIVTGQAVAHTPLLTSLWRLPRIAQTVELEIQRLNAQHEAHGLLDRRKQEIRLFGSLEAMCTLEQILLKSIDKILGESKMSVPISDGDYFFLLQGGRSLMDKLISMSFVQSVSLDIKNRAMIVEGGSVDVKKIMANMHKLQRLSSVDGNGDTSDDSGTTPPEQSLCPVCFCPPEDDASGTPIQLSCSHSYCNDCFHEWITGTRTCQYPLECLAAECISSPTLEVLERCLTREEFQRSMREAVDVHVNKNLDSLQFCYTPGCAGICRLDTSSSLSRLSSCSTCENSFCTECKVEEHEDLSWEQYRAASLPPNRLRIKIVDEILTLRCPRCSLAFLDFEGCFALRCHSCQCGFCGWCLQDCGTDAHSHVSTCRDKLGTDTYFGSEELFEKGQRKWRLDALVLFLKTLGRNERVEVLRSIETDLNDLGIVMEDLKESSM